MSGGGKVILPWSTRHKASISVPNLVQFVFRIWDFIFVLLTRTVHRLLNWEQDSGRCLLWCADSQLLFEGSLNNLAGWQCTRVAEIYLFRELFNIFQASDWKAKQIISSEIWDRSFFLHKLLSSGVLISFHVRPPPMSFRSDIDERRFSQHIPCCSKKNFWKFFNSNWRGRICTTNTYVTWDGFVIPVRLSLDGGLSPQSCTWEHGADPIRLKSATCKRYVERRRIPQYNPLPPELHNYFPWHLKIWWKKSINHKASAQTSTVFNFERFSGFIFCWYFADSSQGSLASTTSAPSSSSSSVKRRNRLGSANRMHSARGSPLASPQPAHGYWTDIYDF